MSEHWHALMPEAEFPADGKLATKVNGWYVLVAKTETGFAAVNDRCTHQASLLSGGRIRRGAVMCPLHGARFELASGRCLGGTYKDLRTFPLRVQHGMIEVAVPLHGPTMEDLPISY
jgi:nitrite reductase/ring-hydroxylating ferredoxin subunit